MNILKNISILGALMVCLLSWTNAHAQLTVPISDGGSVDEVSCADYVVITDSDADGGNYLPNENYVISVCVEGSSTAFGQFIISPELNGDVWDVDEFSNLFVYDGGSTAAPLLGTFNSITSPAGINVSGTTGCLTLEFVSGATSSGAGFTANFACEQPLQPFTFDLTGVPPMEQFQDFTDPAIKICFGDSIIVNTLTSYPLSNAGGNGYEQEDATSFFRYLMGDGTIYQGLGLTEISHTYEDPFGYQVTVTIQDVAGKVEFKQFYVLIAPRPDFTNLAVDDTLCIGQQTAITGGATATDTVGVDATASAILGGGILGEQLFLPDGNDENYETTIVIDEFGADQVIENASDILSFCVNMEHSYLGDLEMMLTCPDGTSIIVFNANNNGTNELFPGGFGGGGTFLGDANDDGSTDPGLGFDYCFSDDASLGTFADEFNTNTVDVNTFQAGTAVAPGTYLPEDLLETFIGCPINGDWTLTIRDNLAVDNGWIFNWSIFFNPEINPSTVYYSPDIVDVYWEDNEDIISNEGTEIIVEPSSPGNNSFTFVAEDEFGCLHDTTVQVYVRPHVFIDDAVACDLTHTLAPANAVDAHWNIISTPSENSVIAWEPIDGTVASYDITVNEYGLYQLQIEEAEATCGYTSTATIDFRPDPTVAPIVTDTTLCIGATVELDAGPQADNSDHFNIVWTNDGNVVAQDTYTYVADETGEHIVTITGVCGDTTATSNIVAISIDFLGNTVCSKDVFASVTLEPQGTGSWSSSEPNMSFTSANQTVTQITAPDYGLFEITFTDDRCVDDGVTQEFRFVEQPTILIFPEEIDFCVDEDALVFNATVEGSNTGEFNWSINGTPLPGTNDTVYFDVLSFEPNELNALEATALDPFGVCAPGTGVNNFIGEWCEYLVPNVVTPNNDGMNDRFHVQYLELIPGAQLTIYDRWGKNIFESSDYGSYQAQNKGKGEFGGWDPTDAGTGTYYYELVLTSINQIESGYIQVLDGDAKE